MVTSKTKNKNHILTHVPVFRQKCLRVRLYFNILKIQIHQFDRIFNEFSFVSVAI